MSVLDSKGKAVTGLTAADFGVREDNVQREVLTAAPATEPLTIAVTVDDSQPAKNCHPVHARRADLKFVKKLDGKAQIALSTYGERPTPLVECTDRCGSPPERDWPPLRAPWRRGLSPRGAPGTIERHRETRGAARRVIVVVAVESEAEFSNLRLHESPDALKQSGAILEVLATRYAGRIARATRCASATRSSPKDTDLTGGRRDQVLAESGLEPIAWNSSPTSS